MKSHCATRKVPGRAPGARILAACALLLAAAMFPHTAAAYDGMTGRGGIPWELDRFIICTIREAQRNVHDTNRDGKVNCIDYSLMFKSCWDRSYGNTAYSCEIVRNKNGSFHHLFIGMRYGGGIVFIEPWTYDPEMFLMEDNWPARKYNPSYNIYGETAKWMGKFYK